MQNPFAFLNRSTAMTVFLGALIALGSPANLRAQGLPRTQPKLLTIIREQVKVGRSAEHSKFEAGYPAAFEKAKSPDSYLALTSLTGPAEAWYLIPRESHAAIGESMKREHKDPVLSGELNRLALADAEYISGVQSIMTVARPDLSTGPFPDLAKTRFYLITTFRIRPARATDFEDVAKMYLSILKRINPNASRRMYQVVAGGRDFTFIGMASVENYADFDQMVSEDQRVLKEAKPEEMAILKKYNESVESVESNHFEVDPVQSYVPQETRQKDPDFWMSK